MKEYLGPGFCDRTLPLAAVPGLAFAFLLFVLLSLDSGVTGVTAYRASTALDVQHQGITLTHLVDGAVAAPGAQRTYRIVLDADQDIAAARLTDVLPSAVTWSGDLLATSGSACCSDGILTWSGPLTAGTPVLIAYGVTVTHAPCFDSAADTDIYTDVSDSAMLSDGRGNTLVSTATFFAIGYPFGTGYDRTFALALGDADNDGDLDLAVGNQDQNQVCWNDGGSFQCQDAFGSASTMDVEWGDVNGDGYLDLAVANSGGQANLVCLNNHDHTFACRPFSRCLHPGPDRSEVCHLALGDVDCDGDLDIALGTRYPDDMASPDVVYYNNGRGAFPITATTCYSGPTLDLALGDVDGDQDLDLVAAGHYVRYVCMQAGTCSGTFTETRALTTTQQRITWSVALGDADGDGDLDIATGEDPNSQNVLYLNDGDGHFAAGLFFGPAWDNVYDLAWGDVDGDGDLDMAAGNLYQRTAIYVHAPLTTAPGFTLSGPVLLGWEPFRTQGVAFGDVDGDSDLDLAVGSNRGQNIVYVNNLGGCVSGRVHGGSGMPVPGALIATGSGRSAVTDGSGTFTVTGLLSGTHALTPGKRGWTFAPPTRTVRVPPDVSGQDFVGTVHLYLPVALSMHQP